MNLAGAGIAGHRWTDSYKRQILDSRTRTTTLISETIARADDGPRVLLSGSGIDFYGDQGDTAVDETSPAGIGFLADVCAAWEASTAAATAAGVRVAHLRTSMVLSAQGGALRKMLPLYKLGLGGRTGNGRQWVSWISIDDEVGAIEHLLDGEVSGPVNLASPNPVTNAEFARTLGHVLKRPAFVPLPPFAPKLVLGSELVDTLLLEGKRVLPRVLEVDGYTFTHPTLEAALRVRARPLTSVVAITTFVPLHYCGPSAILDVMRSANTTTVRWLDDSEMRAWRTYVETVGNLSTAIENDLAPTGLTLGDYQLLVYLSEAPDRRMRMCDLAVALQLSPSGLTRRLDGLVRNGFVRRIGSDDDRRVMLAVLTSSGFEALEAAAPIHVESVRRRILDHLEPDQIKAMGDVFEAIRSALDDQPY